MSGSTHNETIFNNTHLKQRFKGHSRNKLLVGDVGYHLLPYSLTKLQNVNSTAENLYINFWIATSDRYFGQDVDLAECGPPQLIHSTGWSHGLPRCIAFPQTHT
nr:unnamed protein product [Callosobruchus analis]